MAKTFSSPRKPKQNISGITYNYAKDNKKIHITSETSTNQCRGFQKSKDHYLHGIMDRQP